VSKSENFLPSAEKVGFLLTFVLSAITTSPATLAEEALAARSLKDVVEPRTFTPRRCSKPYDWERGRLAGRLYLTVIHINCWS
jgi:hypothetical protein